MVEFKSLSLLLILFLNVSKCEENYENLRELLTEKDQALDEANTEIFQLYEELDIFENEINQEEELNSKNEALIDELEEELEQLKKENSRTKELKRQLRLLEDRLRHKEMLENLAEKSLIKLRKRVNKFMKK